MGEDGTARDGTGREGSVVESQKILKIDPANAIWRMPGQANVLNEETYGRLSWTYSYRLQRV